MLYTVLYSNAREEPGAEVGFVFPVEVADENDVQTQINNENLKAYTVDCGKALYS